MKRLFQAVPFLCTLLLIGLGAFMPRLASLALDRQLENNVVLLENQSISLTLEQGTDFFETLELFSSVASQVELSGGYRMKPEDAEAAAVEARMHFEASGAADEGPKVTPVLITSRSTPGLSGIFWRCVWSDPSANGQEVSIRLEEVLWLDDQSGNMVSFSGQVEWSSLSVPNSSFPQSAVDVAEYCRQSYPVDTVKLALTDEDTPELFTISLTKSRNGQVETYSIPIRIADGWLFFNEMPF